MQGSNKPTWHERRAHTQDMALYGLGTIKREDGEEWNAYKERRKLINRITKNILRGTMAG